MDSLEVYSSPDEGSTDEESSQSSEEEQEQVADAEVQETAPPKRARKDMCLGKLLSLDGLRFLFLQ